MRRYKILHQTIYDFSGEVQLLPHTLRLRPKDGHELRIESSAIDITPPASLRWQRDVEGNSVATASFTGSTQRLTISCETFIQQYNEAPQNFLVADYAVDYPFHYTNEDNVLLAPYMKSPTALASSKLVEFVKKAWQPFEKIQTFALLLRINQLVYLSLTYSEREEEGVQTAEQSLRYGTGSCRDYSCLFMAVARQLGFAARFVSGYIHTNSAIVQSGSTHAWAEIFIPGAGWKGFDPTIGNIVGSEHIAVAVARLPESVPPIAGSFQGPPGAVMTVNVWVTELT